MKRKYIKNFKTDLNNRGVILYVSPDIEMDEILKVMERDGVRHLNRIDFVKENRMFYIENFSLQEVWGDLFDLIGRFYVVLQIDQDPYDETFYVDIPEIFEEND